MKFKFSVTFLCFLSLNCIINAAQSSEENPNRDCRGSLGDISFILTTDADSRKIMVAVTGKTNTALFAPWYVTLIQGNRSISGTPSTYMPGIHWTGYEGFSVGVVPIGVVKRGTFSDFPPWFNFSQSFEINDNITGERLIC
jgi:hypothetical protein